MQKIIYHIHDECCRHSSNTLAQTVAYALKHGYKELYFTEHNYVTVKCPYQARRATYDEMFDYKHRIDLVNRKYKGRLHCYFGYEVEFNKQNRWYLEKMARDSMAEFLIFGNHFYGDMFKMKSPLPLTKNFSTSVEKLKEFEVNQVAAMKSGLFSWIAHPEIFLYSYRKWDKHSIRLCKLIIQLAQEYKLPLAFNVNFKAPFESKDPWQYPVKQFWQLVAKTNIPVIIEADSHDIHAIKVEWLNKAKKLALSYGLKKNLVDKIPLKLLPKKPQLFVYEKQLKKCLSSKFISELKANKVKLIEVDKDTNLLQLIKDNNALNVFTAALVSSPKLIKQTKGTTIYLVSKQIKKLAYSQFLNKFIGKVNP